MDRTAKRIRAARQHAGMSLRHLAGLIGVSASMLSQIENGKARPSVTTLYGLVAALGISLDDLVAEENEVGSIERAAAKRLDLDHRFEALTDLPNRRASPVHQPGTRPVLELETGVTWEQLSGALSPFIDHLLVTYAPGSSSSGSGKLTEHSGYEQAYIIEGELQLQIDFDKHVLGVGDSLSFESSRPHLYRNLTAVPAKGIWTVVGRSSPAIMRQINEELGLRSPIERTQ